MIAERIASLADVSKIAVAEGELSSPLRDFLDGFYTNPAIEKIWQEPASLNDVLHDAGFSDAYLAAVGDHLCRQHGFPRPAWIKSASRVLKFPYFAAKSHGLRMILLEESPASFRERNIFVSANTLSRA